MDTSVGAGRRRGTVLAAFLCIAGGCALHRKEAPEALRARQLMVPVAGVSPAEVPDTFASPRGRGGRRHEALDILAPAGTPVLSADDGRVLKLRRNQLGGLTVYATDPGEQFVYYYAHLAAYRGGLRAGDKLRRGEVIGFVGTTGNARGREPHLHFQVMVRPASGRWWGGAAIDPRAFLVSAGQSR